MLRRGRLVGQEAPPPRVTTPRYQVCVGKEVMGPKVRVLGLVAAKAVGEVAHNFSSAVVPLRKNADASGRLLKRAGIGYRFERCGGF